MIKLFDKWRRNAVKKVKKYRTLTIKSWGNDYEGSLPRAVAACDETGWFYCAMNCMRDGDMGLQDSDGVYERLWVADYADDIDLRNATPEEADLYLKKVDMSDILDGSGYERGAISVIRLDGVTHIIYLTD